MSSYRESIVRTITFNRRSPERPLFREVWHAFLAPPTSSWQRSTVSASRAGASSRAFIFCPWVKSSRNHKALRAAKFNQVRLDGEPHNPSGLVFVVGVVNTRDELPQRQRLLLVIDLHGLNIGQETARALWGVTPPENRSQHGCFMARLQSARVRACAVAAGILTSRHGRNGNRPGAQSPADDVSGAR